MLRTFGGKLFVLLVIVAIGTYYVGYTKLVPPVFDRLLTFVNEVTGRTPSGKPSGYA